MIAYIKSLVEATKHVFVHRVAKTAHKNEWAVHSMYCVAAFIEGHGFYTMIALLLGVIIVINHMTGEG